MSNIGFKFQISTNTNINSFLHTLTQYFCVWCGVCDNGVVDGARGAHKRVRHLFSRESLARLSCKSEKERGSKKLLISAIHHGFFI